MFATSEWDHPEWDMTLILPDDGSRGVPKDYLGEGQDPALLTSVSAGEWSEAKLDDLPEWDG